VVRAEDRDGREQPVEPDPFRFGLVDLFGARGGLVLGAPIREGDLRSGGVADRGADRVDGDVAAADDEDVLAQRRELPSFASSRKSSA